MARVLFGHHDAHRGDIRGALGTIRQHDTAPRTSWGKRLLTLLAVMGPGLIVMVGDNDVGGISTFAQAGQNYGTGLLWTLFLLNFLTIITEFIGVSLAMLAFTAVYRQQTAPDRTCRTFTPARPHSVTHS